MKFGYVFALLFASFVVGSSSFELIKKEEEEYCGIDTVEACLIERKIELYSCQLPFEDDNIHNDSEDYFEYQERAVTNYTQCLCELGQDYYIITNECYKQCGFDYYDTPEELRSSVCSEALRMKESSYIGYYVSLEVKVISKKLTEVQTEHYLQDMLVFKDLENSDDLSSQVSSILKSISDSQRTSNNSSIKSHTTTKGSSSNLAVTVGCGSLLSLILLSLL